MSEAARGWIYRLLTVIILGLAVAGIITQEDALGYVALLPGLFAGVLASANTKVRE